MSAISDFRGDSQKVKGKLSLDRLTLLVYSPRLSLWGSDSDRHIYSVDFMDHFILKTMQEKLDPDFPQGIPSELFRKHYRTSSGIDIQFAPVMPKRKKITDAGYIQAFGSEDEKKDGFCYRFSPSDYGFRIEYNPNDTDLSEIFSTLKYFGESVTASQIRVARLDIAIDYSADVNPSLTVCDRMRKSFIACGSAGIETIYFGSRASKYYIRLYNKRIQLAETQQINLNNPLWRFEVEVKKSFPLSDHPDFTDLFKRFSFYSGGVQFEDWKLNLLLSYAKENGLKSALSFLPESTARRYRKMIDEICLNQCLESPLDVYYRDFDNAFNLLRIKVLSAFGFNFFEGEIKNASANS